MQRTPPSICEERVAAVDYARLVDYHMHHERCGHPVAPMEAYVRAALRIGLGEMGFSDHLFHYWLPPDQRDAELGRRSWPESSPATPGTTCWAASTSWATGASTTPATWRSTLGGTSTRSTRSITTWWAGRPRRGCSTSWRTWTCPRSSAT